MEIASVAVDPVPVYRASAMCDCLSVDPCGNQCRLSIMLPSSPVRSKSMPGSGDGNVIGFEAEPRDGVMLEVRCSGGGITGIGGAFGGYGILPEGGLGIVGRAGAVGVYAFGIRRGG